MTPSDEHASVWLVEFRHKTRTPMYVAAQDVFVLASTADDARRMADEEFRRRRLSRRWWTLGEPVKTMHREVPR